MSTKGGILLFTKKRIIEIFIKLLENKKMTTKEMAEKYNLSQRTAQRDIKDVTDALETIYPNKKMYRDSNDYSYSLNQISGLENKNIFILLKILLSSRALNKQETHEIVKQLLASLPDSDRKAIKDSILNELTFITTLKECQNRTDKIWALEKMIQESQLITFQYTNHEIFENPVTTSVTIRPSSIFFDNYYFFLVGLEEQSKQYITYRIDWMEAINGIKKKEKIEHNARYEHGLKRPITAYGYSGKKMRIQFEYHGFIDYVIDRFPSCKIIKKLDSKSEWDFSIHILQIEVEYSLGVKLWILGESGNIRIISPKEIVEDIQTTLLKTYQRYDEHF